MIQCFSTIKTRMTISKYLFAKKLKLRKKIHLFLPNSKYIKDILKCPFLHQSYTIRYKYLNVQNMFFLDYP